MLGIASLITKLLWAFGAVAAWFRLRKAENTGREKQAMDSLVKAEKDEADAQAAADKLGADLATGRVRAKAPDRFTRAD